MTKQTSFQFSFIKACLFLLLFFLSILLIAGVPLLILKPKMPVFSLETVHVESYKLDLTSQKLVVSSVSSLSLKADNPNRVGLSFYPSKFRVLSQGLVVGMLRIPQFHQPPLSRNVSIQTRVSFECVDVDEIVYRSSREDDESKGVFGIKILGDFGAQVRVFRVTLPKIKVALDCDIYVSRSKFSISNIQVYSMTWNQNHLISLPLNSQTVSKKCSLAILV